MKLLICDTTKIEYFNIPNVVKDYFTINYSYNGGFETINLVAENDNWVIKSDKAISILENKNILESVILKEYNSYFLYLNSINVYINIYIIPDLEEYQKISLTNINELTLGNNGCNINSNRIIPSVIKYVDNKYVITNQNEQNGFIYVNKRKVLSQALNIGDVIFINGVKIIWMESYIKINNINNSITLNNLTVISNESTGNCNYTPVTETERNSKLFTENSVFFHMPRLHSVIKDETISFELPPEKDNSPKVPVALTIGSSAIIGVTSCFTGISAVHGLLTNSISVFEACMQFAMCFFMLIACILFPILTESWQKKQKKKQEKNRQDKYMQYLNEKVDNINRIVKQQEDILHENNITLDEIQKRIKNKSEMIWGREIIDNDFLSVRLGIGDLKAKLKIEAPSKGFSLFDDNLREEVLNITSREYKTSNVPVTISMIENKVTPFIINPTLKQNYVNAIMLQILYYYAAMDLKIIVLTNEENASKWDYLKYMQYTLSSDKEIRFFSTNESELQQISMYLEQIYDKRLDEMQQTNAEEVKDSNSSFWYKNFSEYYLVITDDFKEVKNAPIIDKIINSNYNLGFSLMIFENKLANLPNRVDKFIEIQNNMSGVYSRSLNDDSQVKFKAEFLPINNIDGYAQIIGNIPIETKVSQKLLPSYINFLDMYKVGNISQLNVLSKWKENSPINSLYAQVGIKEGNKPIGLDLHEKFHGPHGLIAGSTGSGKSEFIITYILSMAVNYSPEEVQFVLIDYKGGGLAGAFENKETGFKLPHLIGTITNLDTSEMNRTLVSIQSEMKRRQIIFNETRDKLGESTIDIYKYQRLYREGKVDKPISHLIIISDEFAELKAQQPDFMDELVSTARIGRSLGVHLVLATQKPSGVVDDQIWSNSHFKVCLKVQTVEDSAELLRRPEAAEIKETGRFYLQVGNNEIFELGQSAWAGARYMPTERYMNKIDDSIDFINNNGQVIKSINDEIEEENISDCGEQVTNIVKYLSEIAQSENYDIKSLWLPSIPKDIYLGNLIKKYSYTATPYVLNPVIGEYDKPASQLQGLLTLNLNCENTIIYGIPGAGKENLLSTLIYSTCSYHTVEEVNFYILDFGSGALNIYNKMPHVGDVISAFEKEKVAAQFEFLEKEIKKRKELFADYSGDYNQYCESSGNKVPIIVTILNGYESFMENCIEYDDYFTHLLRDGSKYGIVFVMTVVSSNSVRTTVSEYFSNKILLQLPDKFDYQYMLGAERGMVPSKLFGRGMTIIDDDVCEFQTANIYLKDSINDVIKDLSKQLSLSYKQVPTIKSLPKEIKTEKLLKFAQSIDKVPIGYSVDTVDLVSYDFTKNRVNFIIGNTIIDDVSFMASIIDIIDVIDSVHINLFDFISCVNTDGNMSYYCAAYEAPFNSILENNNEKMNVNIFLGFADYKDRLMPDELPLFQTILNNLNNFTNQIFIFVDNFGKINKINGEDWFMNANHSSGIWYGSDIDSQNIFTINNLRKYDIVDDDKNMIYVINDNNYVVVKGVDSESGEY